MLARITRVKPQSRIQTQQTGFLWCTALLQVTACSEFDCNYVTFPQNIFTVFTPSTALAPPDDASPLAYSSQILLSETMTIIHSISWQNREQHHTAASKLNSNSNQNCKQQLNAHLFHTTLPQKVVVLKVELNYSLYQCVGSGSSHQRTSSLMFRSCLVRSWINILLVILGLNVSNLKIFSQESNAQDLQI